MITLLVSPEAFDQERIEVEGDDYRHLFRARRVAVGERLRAVDGQGRARWAEIDQIDRRRASLMLGPTAPANEPAYALHLLVAALRSERASWLVEKATELGVYSIHFIATERTPRKYAPASLERLQRVAAAALQQCHRSRLPDITGVEPRDTWIARLQDTARTDRYVLRPEAESPASQTTERTAGLVLVGPEGGWSATETNELEALGCRGLSLGDRILRIETAAIAVAARLIPLGSPMLD
ncbi:MAG: RsmE family RNA methyltransferase [Acidobacteriota bacterium]